MIVNSSNGLLGVENGGEIERDSDVNVSRGGGVFSNILKEKFWFCEVKVMSVDEFRVRVRNSGARAHFEEAIEDDEECREMTGNSSASFWTFSTVCWTAFPTVF